MATKSPKHIKNEEIINSVTHGAGVLIAIACTVILIVKSAISGTIWQLVTFSIFGAAMINLYTASTLFHSTKKMRLKVKLNIFDHASIYILIAGTYTPLSLTVLRGSFGWVIFGLIWAMAIAGLIFQLWFYTSKHRKLSTYLYVGMGWVIIVAVVPIIRNTPQLSLWFLLAGCLSYSASPFFYLKKNIHFNHAYFHLLILGGSICHFFSFLFMI